MPGGIRTRGTTAPLHGARKSRLAALALPVGSLDFAGSFALRFPVGAAVALHAVPEVLNALLLVLSTDTGRRVFMAPDQAPEATR